MLSGFCDFPCILVNLFKWHLKTKNANAYLQAFTDDLILVKANSRKSLEEGTTGFLNNMSKLHLDVPLDKCNCFVFNEACELWKESL